MIVTSCEKVAGGKLVKLELEHDGSRIKRAKLTGDFFMYPEDALPKIENSLVGLRISDIDSAEVRIAELIDSNAIQLIGFSAETIAKLAKDAVGESK